MKKFAAKRIKEFIFLCLLLIFESQQVLALMSYLESIEERQRSTFTARIELMAADLLDQLVYEWSLSTPLEKKARVVVMGIQPPVGLNQQFSTYLENHFYQLLLQNSQIGIQPVYCSLCSQTVVHTTMGKTQIARGAELDPSILDPTKFKTHLLLYLDFEVTGSELTLKSSIVELGQNKQFNIIYAKKLATNTGTPPLLRSVDKIQSPQEARQEYINLLTEKSRSMYPVRFLTKIFPAPDQVAMDLPIIPPMLWVETGIDYITPGRRTWISGLTLGITSMGSAFDGWSVGFRFARLVSPRKEYSYTQPNLYAYGAVQYQELKGEGAQAFIDKERKSFQQINFVSKVPLPAIKIGFEAKVQNFYSFGVFLEGFPSQQDNKNLGKVAGEFHSYGFDCGVHL